MVIPYWLPNLNQPIFLQWQFGAQPPNLIPANISGYTAYCAYINLYLRIITSFLGGEGITYSVTHPFLPSGDFVLRIQATDVLGLSATLNVSFTLTGQMEYYY